MTEIVKPYGKIRERLLLDRKMFEKYLNGELSELKACDICVSSLTVYSIYSGNKNTGELREKIERKEIFAIDYNTALVASAYSKKDDLDIYESSDLAISYLEKIKYLPANKDKLSKIEGLNIYE